jgi:hypothetical protein
MNGWTLVLGSGAGGKLWFPFISIPAKHKSETSSIGKLHLNPRFFCDLDDEAVAIPLDNQHSVTARQKFVYTPDDFTSSRVFVQHGY